MHTLWAAKSGFDEDRYGSLTPGKAADFVVLSKNPLAIQSDQLCTIQVLQTWLGGVLQQQGSPTSTPKLLGRMVKAWLSPKEEPFPKKS